MSGHHSWEKLMKERYTPEERARIRAEALKMLEEDDRRRGRLPGGTAPDREGHAGAAPGTEAETRVVGSRP